MKILVLFTGGTIGSTVDGATVHTDPAAASRLLSLYRACLLYTSPSPQDLSTSRMPSSA